MLLADINLCLQLFNQFSFHVTEPGIQPIRINFVNRISRDAISSRLGLGLVLCTESKICQFKVQSFLFS